MSVPGCRRVPEGAARLALAVIVGALVSCGQAPRGLATPTTDTLVDIGGRRLHLLCAGSGRPTVIMEAGLGSSSSTWRAVQPAVSEVTRVCAYDRAGMGTSDPDPRTKQARRTSRVIVEDLSALLRAAAIPAPYVLVGHSLGGVHLRLFASIAPQEVVGMVLVDFSHEEQADRLAASGYVPPPEPDTAAEDDHDRTDMPASLKEVGEVHWHADIPLIVLSHGRPITNEAPGITAEQSARLETIWLELQKELATRSPQGQLIVAKQSGHFVQSDEPQLVIDAVRQVVEAARGRGAQPALAK